MWTALRRPLRSESLPRQSDDVVPLSHITRLFSRVRCIGCMGTGLPKPEKATYRVIAMYKSHPMGLTFLWKIQKRQCPPGLIFPGRFLWMRISGAAQGRKAIRLFATAAVAVLWVCYELKAMVPK